jgi:hypothetical protein
LAVHFLVFGGLELTTRLGLWREVNWFERMKAALLGQPVPPPEPLRPAQPPQALERELPLIFVDVEATQATEDAPKESAYYSALNSKAANPDTSVDSNVPRITGEQTKVVKTTDTPLPQPTPVQPFRPQPLQPASHRPEAQTAEAQPKPKGGEKLGDLAMVKPALRPGPSEGSDRSDTEQLAVRPQEKPRRLADLPKHLLAGRKMQQEGGVKRYAVDSSLDVRATPFGAYDAAIIAAIQQRWYALLDQNEFARDRSGHVALDFRLNHDGRITEMKVAENTVGEVLSAICQRAVLDPSPFAKWPPDMRRMVGATYREVRFTFYYN